MPESIISPVFIPFTPDAIAAVKKALRSMFPDDKSSHLTEALAAAAGFNTHAALLAEMAQAQGSSQRFKQLVSHRFMERLNELAGMSYDDPEDAILFDTLKYPEKSPVIRTWSRSHDEIDYDTLRKRAWRNLMVAGINAGIEHGLFGPLPDQNWWPGFDPDLHTTRSGHVFRFEFAGMPAAGYVGDAGYDELSIHVALLPSEDITRVRAGNAGFWAGEAFAWGWLERREATYLQVSGAEGRRLNCRRRLLKQVAEAHLAPLCFADRGSFKM